MLDVISNYSVIVPKPTRNLKSFPPCVISLRWFSSILEADLGDELIMKRMFFFLFGKS